MRVHHTVKGNAVERMLTESVAETVVPAKVRCVSYRVATSLALTTCTTSHLHAASASCLAPATAPEALYCTGCALR